ncbi:hypothetical protein PsorP6_003662 [Peronosclerospora sorghi]|uniref:Uncharacterized protein n=1 Tax=Peronosclerospora sorghi TaxID=230839 RepID=A0ACC0VM10_9STRA|nr:hypothetical protein PsorP6_003662 [Peronosclerospora sorghi]
MAGFQHLSKITSEYMLAHPDNFLSFMELDESAGGGTDYAFIIYCNRVATTADWGGQLKLRVLASALRIPIEVFSAKGDMLMAGREFDDEADENAPKLQLTYTSIITP